MKQNKFDKIKRLFKKQTKKEQQEGRREKKTHGLTLGMIRIIIFCLFIPYLSLSVVLFYFSTIKTNKRIEETVLTSMENAAEICSMNIMSAIKESKRASYDGIIKKSYNQYLQTGNEADMYKTVSEYLNSTYKYSSTIANTILLFDKETTMEYYTYSNMAGATYANINFFKSNALPYIAEVAKTLGTKTRLVVVGNTIYIVRNIVTSNYVPFATLVMEVNVEQMFKNMGNIVWKQGGLIYVDDKMLNMTDAVDSEERAYLMEYAKANVLTKERISENQIIRAYDRKRAIASLTMKVNGQKISWIVRLNKKSLFDEKSTLIYAYVIVIILLIPLLYGTIRYFVTNISKPISGLMTASEKIEKGEYGYKLQEFHRNKEFEKLVDMFNHMSVSLEDSFNRIYAEEIALRDANLNALQSQINPHFLNNTLEIINWKARMSGNDDVSGMIESLGVMMEATMNRKNEHFITIREELKYVDAYLYIIVQRFGNKFQFSQDVDQSVLDFKIPRLMIQPLVENMVEHGGDLYGNRIGVLKIFEDEEYLYIIVENNGDIKAEDAKKIEKLLHAKKFEKGMHNVGIRNVNLRLKMLYGEESGLTITNPKKNLTVSEVMIDKKKFDTFSV